MGRYVVNAGHETLKANDKVILYVSYDCDNVKANRHICMADENALEWDVYNKLDLALKAKNNAQVIIMLNHPDIRPWWRRAVAYLQLQFPGEAPFDIFMRAWARTY